MYDAGDGVPGGGRLRSCDPPCFNWDLVVIASPDGVRGAVEDVEAVGEDPLYRTGILGFFN
jgi:hypothetical protein